MLLFLLTVSAASAAAPVCSQLEIEATVAPDLRTVAGVVRCQGVRPARALAVATYPRVLRTEAGLDDVNLHWLYPEGFQPAEMLLWRGEAPLQSDSNQWQEVGPPDAAEAADAITLRFVTRVPTRAGLFGRNGGALYLLAGWHPVFAQAGQGTRPVRIRYRVTVPAGLFGFIGTHPITSRAAFEGRSTFASTFEGTFEGTTLPLLLAPSVQVAVSHSAAVVIVVPETRRRPALPPPERVAQGVWPSDVAAMAPDWHLRAASAGLDRRAVAALQETLRAGAEFARGVGLAVRPMMVVLGPLREQLVERFDGGILVSDRAFHLLPPERFLKLHRLRLWREQFGAYVEPHARRVERDLPAELVADAVGAALRDEIAVRRYRGKEFAPDLLETFAIIPEIEALIYAPQIPFVDAYFEAIDETPRRRWHVADFAHDRPRGKLLHEKLSDALGAKVLGAAARAYVRGGGRSWLDAVADVARASRAATEPSAGGAGTALPAAASDDVRGLVEPWLGAYPEIDYSLGEISVGTPGTPGTSGIAPGIAPGASGITVSVQASGPAASSLREPITVRLVDGSGTPWVARRVGPGRVGFQEAVAPPISVEIDPSGRLAETNALDRNHTAKYNNRTPPRWRFLLNNISGLVAVTAGELELNADFSLRRIGDLGSRWDFLADGTPSALGGAVAYSYGFGTRRTPLTMSQRLGASLSAHRLRVDADGRESGRQVAAALFYQYDDRLSPYTSFEGRGLTLRVAGAFGDGDGNGDGGDHARLGSYGFVAAGASALWLWRVAFQQALALRLRGDVQFGNTVPEQSKLRLGGRSRGGRGYEQDEARATRRAIATGEYRHVIREGERTDFWGLATWTRIEGAVFADAIALPVREPSCERDGSFDVGYGLRFLGEVLNVSPGALTVDMGVPLNRCSGPKSVPGAKHAFPFVVYVAFEQSLLNF